MAPADLAPARTGPERAAVDAPPAPGGRVHTHAPRPARGRAGAEEWVKLVNADQPAPTDPAVHSFLTMTIRPRVRAEFRAGDEGKTAVYMLRWVNARGEKGPWSAVCAAAVAA